MWLLFGVGVGVGWLVGAVCYLRNHKRVLEADFVSVSRGESMLCLLRLKRQILDWLKTPSAFIALAEKRKELK